MLKRLPLLALSAAMVLSACTSSPNAPDTGQPASKAFGIQQTDNEGSNDASLDAILRELDAMTDDPTATSSAGPETQSFGAFGAYRVQQRQRDGGYGWSGGYGYGPYGYGIFARCQRIYRRCLNRAYLYYSGNNPYQFCRRLRNRCASAAWLR